MDRIDKVRLKTGWSKLEKRNGPLEGSTTCASNSIPLKTLGLSVIRRKLQDNLVKKYAVSSKLYYLKVIDTLVKGARDSGVIRLKYEADVNTSTKTLKRFYQLHESFSRIEQMSEYFKYHYEIPRLFLPRVVDVIDSFHDRKRNKIYQQVKRLIGKENIVGDDSEPNQSSMDQQAKHKGGYGFIFVGDELERLRDGLDYSDVLDQKNETLKLLLTKLSYKASKHQKKQHTSSISELSMSAFSNVIENQVKDFKSFITLSLHAGPESPKRAPQKPKIQISHRLAHKLSEITHMGASQPHIPKPALRVNISPRAIHQNSLQQDSSLKSPTRFYKQNKPSLLIGENTAIFGKSRVSQPSIVDLTSNRELKITYNLQQEKSAPADMVASGSSLPKQLGLKKHTAEWLNKGWFKTLGSDHRTTKSPTKLPLNMIDKDISQKINAKQFKKEIEEFHLLQKAAKEAKSTTNGLTNSFKDLRGLSTLQTSAKSFSPTINVVRSARAGKESFNLLNLELANSNLKSVGQSIQMRRYKTQGSQGYIKEGSYQIDGLFSPKGVREPIQALVKSNENENRGLLLPNTSQRIHNLQKPKKNGSMAQPHHNLQTRLEQRGRVSLTNMITVQSPRDAVLVRRMKSQERANIGSIGSQELLRSGAKILQASILSSSGQIQQGPNGAAISISPNRNPSFTVQQPASSVKNPPQMAPLKMKATSHRQSSSTNKEVLANVHQPGHASHKSNASRVGQQTYKSPPNQLLCLLPHSAVGRSKMLGLVKFRNI